MWQPTQWQQRNEFEKVGNSLEKYLRTCWIERAFPIEAWKTLGHSGMFSLLQVPRNDLPEAILNAAAAFEGFSKGSFDMGFNIPILVHAFLGLPVLYRSGSDSARRHLKGLTNGESILAFAVTEPHGGSKALHSECSLIPEGNHYRLSGKKWHITNAPHCTHILAWVTHPSNPQELVAVLVMADAEGVHCERIATLAASSSVVGSIDFKEVKVSKEDILFLDGGGKKELHDLLIVERSLGVISSIGILEKMLERSLAFASDRKVGGKVILDHQHIQRRLSDMAIRLESLRSLSQSLLIQLSTGADATQVASIAKMCCTRFLMESAIDSAQLAGTYGMLEEAQYPMILLDSLGCTVGGGTEEIHRTTIVKWLKHQSSLGQLYREGVVAETKR